MKIKSHIAITSYLGGKHSYTITPEMGVISHFPRATCLDLINKGAVEVVAKKSSKEVADASAE